jgi:hypothetical protein
MLAVVSFVGGVVCSIQDRFCGDITVNFRSRYDVVRACIIKHRGFSVTKLLPIYSYITTKKALDTAYHTTDKQNYSCGGPMSISLTKGLCILASLTKGLCILASVFFSVSSKARW